MNKDYLQQWERRVVIFKYIYSIIIDETLSYDDKIEKAKDELKDKDDYIYQVVYSFINNEKEYESMISKYLSKNWTVQRLDYIDKSIIFASISEYYVHKIDKSIIIDQAIITSKKYGIHNSFKFINSILDKILVVNMDKEKNEK